MRDPLGGTPIVHEAQSTLPLRPDWKPLLGWLASLVGFWMIFWPGGNIVAAAVGFVSMISGLVVLLRIAVTWECIPLWRLTTGLIFSVGSALVAFQALFLWSHSSSGDITVFIEPLLAGPAVFLAPGLGFSLIPGAFALLRFSGHRTARRVVLMASGAIIFVLGMIISWRWGLPWL